MVVIMVTKSIDIYRGQYWIFARVSESDQNWCWTGVDRNVSNGYDLSELQRWKDVREQKCMQMSFSLLSLPIQLIVALNPELYKCADFCSYVIIFILGKETYKRQKRFIAGKCLKIHRQEQKSSYLKYAIVQANYHHKKNKNKWCLIIKII